MLPPVDHLQLPSLQPPQWVRSVMADGGEHCHNKLSQKGKKSNEDRLGAVHIAIYNHEKQT